MRTTKSISVTPPPAFLKVIWAEAKRRGLDKLTMREIDAEIQSYRKEKRAKEAVRFVHGQAKRRKNPNAS